METPASFFIGLTSLSVSRQPYQHGKYEHRRYRYDGGLLHDLSFPGHLAVQFHSLRSGSGSEVIGCIRRYTSGFRAPRRKLT
jgi:hypothetical protein